MTNAFKRTIQKINGNGTFTEEALGVYRLFKHDGLSKNFLSALGQVEKSMTICGF